MLHPRCWRHSKGIGTQFAFERAGYAAGSASGHVNQEESVAVDRGEEASKTRLGHDPTKTVATTVRVYFQTGGLPPLPNPIAANG